MEKLVSLVVLIALNSGSVWSFVLNGNGHCSSMTTHTYTTTDSALSNPYRGWYYPVETHDTNFHSLTASSLRSELHQYATEDVTVIFRLYYLDSYRYKPLDSALLNKMRADLSGIRDAGKSVLLRFAYTEDEHTKPYKDTDVSHVLNHIQGLKSHGIFSDFEGIIFAVQAGFIGVWGEWYYTAHFGNAGHISSTDWQHRNQVVTALLNAVPDSSNILVRTPYYKYHLWGEGITTYQDLLSTANRQKARVGFHNDCFLASSTDQGTYNSVTHDKAYLQKETTYTVMAGETCAVDPPRSECGTAEKELGQFHWTTLNVGYNTDVYKSWHTGRCYDRITRNLGYKLALKSMKLPTSTHRSSGICFDAILRNYGYAAPIKEFTVSLVLRSDSGRYYSHNIPNLDVRTWLPGSDHHFKGNVDITHVPNGSYKVYLAIRNKLMSSNSKYNILLANDGVPYMSQRLNYLKHHVTIH